MNRSLKIALTIATIITTSLSVLAETVSQKEASRLAQIFFNAANGRVMPKPKFVYNGKQFTTDRLFSPFYVYNMAKSAYVIISADNKAFPILGYDLTENFDPNNMDAEIFTSLSRLAKDIEVVRYDSRIPEMAVTAWNDYREYVANTLKENPEKMMLDNATEFYFQTQPHISGNIETEDSEPENIPFELYDSFLAEYENGKRLRQQMLDEKINPQTPILTASGGGHFQIRFPEMISIARVYNMQGAMVALLTFKDTDTATINLDKEPVGFYVALVNGESGKPYGFKLYK